MQKLTRLYDWRTRMEENLRAVKHAPFVWGTHDCALFAGKHVQAITGVDYWSEFYQQYTDAAGALQCLKDKGYADLLDYMRKTLPECKPPKALVGDLMLFAGSEGIGHATGIVLGEKVGLLAPNGYGRITRVNKNIVAAFSVGY